MKEMIEGYQKFEVQFRVVIPNIVQTFADAKILDF
jgi:ABC-type glycerol-3-phosphate transport system permease component